MFPEPRALLGVTLQKWFWRSYLGSSMIDAGPGLTKSLCSLGVYMFSLVFLALPLSFSCPSIKVIKSPSYGTDLARV